MCARASMTLASLALVTLTGCGPYGWVYTHKTRPLVTDMKETKVGSKTAMLSTKEIHEPFTGASIGIAWDSRAIGDAAKQKGIEHVYFADLHTKSFFGGIFRMDRVQVYGD